MNYTTRCSLKIVTDNQGNKTLLYVPYVIVAELN